MADETKEEKKEEKLSPRLADEASLETPPPPSSSSEKKEEASSSGEIKGIGLAQEKPVIIKKEEEGEEASVPAPAESKEGEKKEELKQDGEKKTVAGNAPASQPPLPPDGGDQPPVVATVGLPPKKKFSFKGKKAVLIGLIIFLSLVGIVGAVYLVQRSQNLKKYAQGGPCDPVGCYEAFCGWQEGKGEVAMCHTCQDNSRWSDAVECSQYFSEVCHDPNNPSDNTAKGISGCSYNPPPTCGDGKCDTNENCDPNSDHYCPEDCDCSSIPADEECPTNVMPYVVQTGELEPGYANCNGNAWCLELRLPEEYADCKYKAEAYADYPQNCENQEANRLVDKVIGNGGKICFSDFDWGSYCKAQLDIRADFPGSEAGNVKTYKINCGETPTETPTEVPTETPTETPTEVLSPTSIPEYQCNCAEIALFDEDWNLIWRRRSGYEVTEGLISPGQKINILVMGYEDYPISNFVKAQVKINSGEWQETIKSDVPPAVLSSLYGVSHPYSGGFYLEYTVPEEGGDFYVQAQIHVAGEDVGEEGGRWCVDSDATSGSGSDREIAPEEPIVSRPVGDRVSPILPIESLE